MNIVLTGFMGTGKSTVGKIVADKLSYQYLDTDESIQKDVRMSISDIFAKKGEPFFREVESKIIELVSLLDKFVIATGGGVPLKASNMDLLEKNGRIFCLSAKPETILERLKGDSSRPLLKKKDPLAEIKNLLEQRKDYYKRCFRVIETDNIALKQAADIIIKEFSA